MGDKEIKVTDKRMFTPDGELKEEYRFVEENATAAAAAAADASDAANAAHAVHPAHPADTATGRMPPSGPGPEPSQAGAAGPAGTAGSSREPASDPRRRREEASMPPPGRAQDMPPPGYAPEMPPLELPGSPPGMGAPTFYDLAAILAEPVALYLGDLPLEDGQSAENLEMARLHIELLDVLRQKTAGNLTAQEAAFLEDLLYRMRVRYVQKRG